MGAQCPPGEATKGPEMPLEDWALLPAQQSADVSISVAEEGASTVNGKIRAGAHQGWQADVLQSAQPKCCWKST